jgi:hypothetical protein
VKRGPDRESRTVELEEEERRLRWLRIQTDLLKAVLWQDHQLDLSGARSLVFAFRGSVLEMFPGTEETFDLILLPRFERIIRERWAESSGETVN